MLGLRGQESSKFNIFFSRVQRSAQDKGCVFFVDAGDGRDFETDIFEGEDLSGWLVPKERIDEFQPLWENDDVSDDWSELFGFAVWENQDDPTIRFEI